jgi:HEAT repeat protein
MLKARWAYAAVWFLGVLLSAFAGPALAQIGGYGAGSPTGQGTLMQQVLQGGGPDIPTGQPKAADAVKDAKKALADADPRVRVEGLEKLRSSVNPDANELLLRGLVDPDVRVRIKAIDVLGVRDVSDAVPILSQRLFLRETPAIESLHAVAALGRIGDQRGTLPVMEYLKEQSDERSRGTAVFALGEIGDPRATEVLAQTVADAKSSLVRRLAQEALEKIDGELPTRHQAQLAAERAKQYIPTDQKLEKLRKMDAELHHQ